MRIIFLYIFLLYTSLLSAQSFAGQNPIVSFQQMDSLFVIQSQGQKYLLHRVQAGQTLYAIKDFYGVKLSDLHYSNPTLAQGSLSVGQELKIPVVSKALNRYPALGFQEASAIPVYYKVKSSETLYRIARVYFGMTTTMLMARNAMASSSLSKDQVLKVAWVDRNGIPDSLQRYTGLTGILGEENAKNRYRYEKMGAEQSEVMEQGIACWDRNMNLSGKFNLYVLCSKVSSGSVVRIENPMTKRYVYARVVDKMPETSFSHRSIVFLTPTVADALGILDAKIYVKLYYKQ